MPASQPANFNLQEFTDVGQLMVGGRLYTYAYGTTAQKIAYTDPDGTVPHTYTADGVGGQYIALNARGELPTPLYLVDGSYDIVLKRADGSTVWTRKADGVENSNRSLAAQFATTSGSSLIGFIQAGADAGARSVQDKLRDQVSVFDFMTKAQIADVQSGEFAVDITTAVQAAINSGASRIHAPKGGYSIATLDLRGKYIVLYGDGIDNTIFQCNAAGTAALFNANEDADVHVSPLVLRDMSLDGGGKAASCLDVRYRHLVNLENVHFIGAAAQNIKAKDTWLMSASQCLSEGAPIGMWLVGSNHRSKFDSFSFQGNSIWQVKIEGNGTAADGNMALQFDNCDVEFGTGGGVYIDAKDVVLNSCYTGENIDGPVLQVQNGAVLVEGGTLFFGHTADAFGIVANGGKTLIRKVGISGQINPGLAMLLSGASTNAVRFEDCVGNTTIGGDPTINGDLLDYGPPATVYAKRLGKSFAANGFNVTFTSSLVGNGNSRMVSCNSVTGAPAIIQLQSGLINNADWMDGSPAYLVLVYESSKTLSVRLAGGAFGGNPAAIIGYPSPATAGKKTYLKFDFSLVNGAFNILEMYIEGCVAGDFITVHECFLADARTLNKGSGNWGNLYKC